MAHLRAHRAPRPEPDPDHARDHRLPHELERLSVAADHPQRCRQADAAGRACRAGARACPGYRADDRSEEHTSELQSLMRISYAVFCLKKKKNKIIEYTQDMTQ